jgi:CheY-like chemotaxis protein
MFHIESKLLRNLDQLSKHYPSLVCHNENNHREAKMFTGSLDRKTQPRIHTDLHPLKHANVLIVDDDVDSAILVESIFRQFGCETTYALDSVEAKKQIISGKADIIILDWVLNEKTRADQVLLQSIKFIEKFNSLKKHLQNHKIKIISYSSLNENELELPKSLYFEHFDHWQKPIGRTDLIHKTSALMNTFNF